MSAGVPAPAELTAADLAAGLWLLEGLVPPPAKKEELP